MKMLSEILRHEPVWVNPAHRVQSALYLMRGHGLGCLPVLDGPRLVGILTYPNVLGVDTALMVSQVMESMPPVLAQSLSVREAAEIMLRANQEFLPVVDEQGILKGIVTSRDLLTELRRPSDPLTELPWSDTMREWASDMLQAGHEITIIFFDVNDFGMFNKLYGHVVGDTVLRNVANILRDACYAETESVCRYGGDEFCIATLRRADEAQALAERIAQEVDGLRVIETNERPVTITYGIRGGRRTRERDQIHYASTLNNLINLASRDCMLQKANRSNSPVERIGETPMTEAVVQSENPALSEPALPPAPAGSPPSAVSLQSLQNIYLAALDVRFSSDSTQVHVELKAGVATPPHLTEAEEKNGRHEEPQTSEYVPLASYSVSLARAASQQEILRLVAEATRGALQRSLPANYDIRIEDIFTHATTDGRPLATVLGTFQTPDDRRPIAGTVFVGDDLFRAAANATLAAANRQMSQHMTSLASV